MKRARIVISATVAGTAAVLGFHAHPAATPVATAPTAPPRAVASTPSGSSGGAGTSASTGSSGSATTSSSSGTKDVLGDPMSTRYGAAQVRVTVSNGKIVKVEAVQLQNADPKSASISSSAEPILRQSVLAKQTAAVDAVSGATYTSLSYEGSLQSALDKLSFAAPDGSVASSDMSQLQ
jgi:uncharacterized protein with FMN-binding domain